MSVVYRMFWVGKKRDLPTAIREEVDMFVKRYGYLPATVSVRPEEWGDRKMKIHGVHVELYAVQAHHFHLGPLLFRTPRIFTGVRNNETC